MTTPATTACPAAAAPPAPASGTAPSPADAWLLAALERRLDAATIDSLRAAREGVWAAVVRRGLLTADELLAVAAAHRRMPVADFGRVSSRALALVPERWARRFRVVPLDADEQRLVVATARPDDLDCERTLAFAAGRSVTYALAAPAAIDAAIERVYRPHERGEAPPRAPERVVEVELLGREQDAAPPSDADDGGAGDGDGGTVTRLVDELLGEGVAGRASDIHIEPEEQGIAVRHRVDGVLRLARRLPRAVAPALVSRIKIVSGLDIADRLRPQDGRARVAVNGVAVDLRVSTLPASHGEKVVIRVLDARATVPTLEGMGFNDDELQRIEQLLQAREGLILVTGPTGSGKTTTLYAALRRLKQRGVNIVTVEDPIEYRLPGIVQVQVHERAGLTFAAALRSIMRQDPDVLLIGEIRDRETAEIAIQASLTGHLVLSTLHTNDAASAVTRLIDIGVASYKIATAVKGVLAQRLIRRLCHRCRGAAPETVSCATCGGTGHHGRLAIAEVLIGSPEFERRVAAGEPTERIAAAGRAGGMRSLWASGLVHVGRGETTVDELLRVAAPDRASGEDTAATLGAPVAPVPAETSAGPGPRVPSAPPRAVSETVVSPFEGAAFALRPEVEAMPLAPVTHVPRRRVDGGARGRYLTQRPVTVSRPVAPERSVVQIAVGTVDVFAIRPLAEGRGDWRVLVLQRAADTRCPSSWETVHGRIEPGEEPEDAALRELREETGLRAERLYCVAVQPFFMRPVRTVQLSIVFAAFVAADDAVTLGPEHQDHAWVSVDEARRRFAWPAERGSLAQIVELLATGDAGPVDDVLRVL